MNRYLLFFGDIYYPGRGMDNFLASYETLNDAKKEAINKLYDSRHCGYVWARVFDSETEQTVYSREIRGGKETGL